MTFGLKNARATYQRLVNKTFFRQIGKTMEIYVENMLVKRMKAKQDVKHLGEIFNLLSR